MSFRVWRALGVAALFAGLVSTGSSASAAVIFSNSFESPLLPPGGISFHAAGTTFDGWAVTGVPPFGDVLLLDDTYNENGNNPLFNAQHGNQSLDITGTGNTGPNGVNREIATVAGQEYELSFYVGRADSTANGFYLTPSTVGVSLDGGPTLSFTNSNVTANGVNWLLVGVLFTALDSSTNLSFLNLTTTNSFAGVDNVTIASVPEPASLAIWGLGLAGIGIYRRRKSAV
jgi:hypothetical protein